MAQAETEKLTQILWGAALSRAVCTIGDKCCRRQTNIEKRRRTSPDRLSLSMNVTTVSAWANQLDVAFEQLNILIKIRCSSFLQSNSLLCKRSG
jgi:hypothetical protein